VRDALQLIRGQKRVRLFEEEDLMRLADVASTPADAGLEQEHMKLLYRAEFQAAFRRAVEALPAKEREILRAHFVDGQTIDQLGETHGVHRATAARWVERARRSLVAAIRRTLMNELRVDEATYKSLLRLVASRLDLSVRLMFDKRGE
jgi:RNA polymerase sigma-70 factor (ECF subfamily)